MCHLGARDDLRMVVVELAADEREEVYMRIARPYHVAEHLG